MAVVVVAGGSQKLEGNPWDINPDGKRLLVIKPGGTTGEGTPAEILRKIIIVLNWFEEPKLKAPVD